MSDPNRKKIWGVILGDPQSSHPYPNDIRTRHLIGQWIDPIIGACGNIPGILFFTKKEAEEFAISRAKIKSWNYHAKKYHPRRDA
jgi:hypothetical protein